MRVQEDLDLFRLDAHPVDLHLPVEAPEPLERAVLTTAAAIPGAIEPRPRSAVEGSGVTNASAVCAAACR
jgi:hypothetical protein